MIPLDKQNLLSRIAVDLTPVLPAGDNGGAKVFAIALIKQLASMTPKTQWILLTQSLSHQEISATMQQHANILCQQALTSSQKRALPKFAKFMLRLQRIPYARLFITYCYYFLCDLLKLKQTKDTLKTLNADLLFCPFTAPTFSRRNLPTVCVVHDIQFKTYPHFFDETSFFYRSYTFKRACKKSRALIAISDYTHQSILRYYKHQQQKVMTIHTNIIPPLTKKRFDDQRVLKELGLTSQKYLLYPSNFWKHKNHEMLLSAFQMLIRKNALQDSLKLVLTGAPDARQQWLQHSTKQMGLAEHIVFPGYLPNEQLQQIMQHAAGVIFPSLYEGFGLPVIEAMAAGVPVACSNCTAMPEIAGNAALLFNPTTPHNICQALQTLLFDKTQRTLLIQRGVARAAEFANTTEMAKRYWDTFVLAKEGL